MNEQREGFRPETKEAERSPRQVFMITRHVERTPSGELTADGLSHAEKKGASLVGAEVHKGYSSKEESDRAFNTLEKISERSGTVSDSTGEPYKTRRRYGLFYYDFGGPFYERIKELSQKIDMAVKEDYPDYNKSNPEFAQIRKSYQPIGVREILADDQLVHLFAMGVASQLDKAMKISNKYVERRQSAVERGEADAKKITGDIVTDLGIHGGLAESLLKKAMIRLNKDGNERVGFTVEKDGKGVPVLEQDINNIIQPGESIKTSYAVGAATPEHLPLDFEKGRFAGQQCYLDRNRIERLAEQFEEYKVAMNRWEQAKKDSLEEKKEADRLLLASLDKLRSEYK